MFHYENAAFYSDFFKSCPGIDLTSEFRKSEETGEENLFVGEIEVVGTIHKLVVRVEIPLTFPHHKLVFRTKSLFGYPHLIPTLGKPDLGSWFCLNTPFAETAEEQLHLEIGRLKDWVNRQMREDLPPRIEDPSFVEALAFANAYEWENTDEVKEFNRQAFINFLGDYYFEPLHCSKKGILPCIKTPDNRFYVVSNPDYGTEKIPYLVIDELPPSQEFLRDFIKLKNHYNWSEEDCKHLLPDFNTGQQWEAERSEILSFHSTIISEEEALNTINKIRYELNKDCPLLETLDGSIFDNPNGIYRFERVNTEQKDILLQELDKIEKKIRIEHGYKSPGLDECTSSLPPDEQAYEDYLEYEFPYEWHFFALGFKDGNKISWLFFRTSLSCERYEKKQYKLVLVEYILKKLKSIQITSFNPQLIDESQFFGRGAFS